MPLHDCRRLVRGTSLLAVLGLAVGTAVGDRSPEGRRAREGQGDDFALFAGPSLILSGNQFQCGIDNVGSVCAAVGLGSLNQNGGFWPLGTSNNYIWNTGIQLAGILSDDAGPWAGDTIGVYIFDASFGPRHATKLTNIFDSLDPDDLEEWPAEAYVEDPEIFAPILLGRKTASQQDSWVQYWEGDPLRNSNRKHPLGVKFTQRSMSWNYPSGNESIIYFMFEIENVTADPVFQELNEQMFFGGDAALPDAGWTLTELYASFGTDMDVGNAFENFSTAILPFDVGLSYIGGFQDQFFEYPPAVFHPPFFTRAPGIVGIKYLKSPLDPVTGEEVGLTLFSITQNPFSTPLDFPDPTGDTQLWRYLSGQLDPGKGDGACSVEAEIATANPSTTKRSVCFVAQQSSDTRFYQASGPFNLGPGQTATIVVAYIAAPTVETMLDGSPSGIVPDPANANRNPPGFPSFHPGFASARGCDVNGTNCSVTRSAAENPVLPIERGAGWFRYDGLPPSGSVYPPAVEHPSNKIEENDVRFVPGSFLGRALVAQTVFDNKFLLGFPPEPPPFYLVPGDDQVTVIWEPSATETEGDPFYEVTSDPESALYNPNYRRFDVEGYRVWRSTTVGGMELIAQFDYADTEFLDHTCETVHPDEDFGAMAVSTETGNLIPVIGYAAGEICPFDVDDPLTRPIDAQLVFNNGGPGGAPGEGVARNPAAVAVDTAIMADRVTGPVEPLRDTGVSFFFKDETVKDNFTYFYAVSAFDVNSMASGPHTLRSARVTQSATPRASNSALQAGFDADVIVSGDDGVPLDLTQSNIAPDVDTGIFPGPQQPTNSLDLLINPPPADVADLLTTGQLVGKFDSVTAEDVSFGCAASGGNALGACLVVHMTFDNGLEVVSSSLEIARPVWDSFGEDATVTGALGAGAYPFDGERLADFGIPPDAGAGVAAGLSGTFDMSISDPSNLGQRVRRFPTGRYQPGGNRWFDGTVNDTPDPTTFIRAGHIDGIDSVWAPINHTEQSAANLTALAGSGQIQCFGYTMAILSRAADFQVTWGEGGTVTVRDITHNVPVDFKEAPQMSYGFLNTDGNRNGVIDWQDFDYLDVIRQATSITNTFCELFSAGVTNPARSVLAAAATIQPVFLGGGNPLINGDPMPATGNGFGLYINGERYIFLTDNLPAAGTVWTYRTYNGRIRAQDPLTDDPSGYELRGGSGSNRSPAIPNMVFTLDVVDAGIRQVKNFDLKEVHAVPDPYLGTSRLDRAPTTKKMMFVNLPPVATIRIYTVSGILVDVLNHEDATGGGRAEWDIRNRNNQFVASGVYFFHVVTPDKDEYVGKFTVVNAVQ